MIIMVKRGLLGKHTIPYKEYFEKNSILTLNEILNWDMVVDNITNLKIRNKVVAEGVLFGIEYPPDTPITEGGDNEDV